MKKYYKKPIVIEAVRWDGKMYSHPKELPCIYIGNKDKDILIIKTLEGDMICNIGDYIIKGIKGEFYPCREDIFLESYEAVE